MGKELYGGVIPRILLFLFAVTAVSFAACVVPYDGYNITSSITICDNTYNLTTALNVTNDSVYVTCNNSVFIGNADVEPAFRIRDRTNVTIIGCTVSNYSTAVYTVNSSYVYLRFFNVDNTTFGFLTVALSHHVWLQSNFVNNSGAGIGFALDTTTNVVESNSILNSLAYGISFDLASTYNYLWNNYFTNNTDGDIHSDGTSTWTLVNGTYPYTDVTFYDSVVNATPGGRIEDYFTIGPDFVSADTVTNPGLKAPANITIDGLTYGNASVYYSSGYQTSAAAIIAAGSPCNATFCSGVSYDNTIGEMKFTVNRFSGFAVRDETPVPATTGVGVAIVLGTIAVMVAAIGAKLGYASLIWGAGLVMLMITIAAALAVI